MVGAFKDNIQRPRKQFFLFRLRSKFHILSAEEVEFFVTKLWRDDEWHISITEHVGGWKDLKIVNNVTSESGVHTAVAIVTLSKGSHILLTRNTLGKKDIEIKWNSLFQVLVNVKE